MLVLLKGPLSVLVDTESALSTVNPSIYWGTSLIRNRAPLGPYMYSRTMPRALW